MSEHLIFNHKKYYPVGDNAETAEVNGITYRRIPKTVQIDKAVMTEDIDGNQSTLQGKFKVIGESLGAGYGTGYGNQECWILDHEGIASVLPKKLCTPIWK